jgi:hypothetical protein
LLNSCEAKIVPSTRRLKIRGIRKPNPTGSRPSPAGWLQCTRLTGDIGVCRSGSTTPGAMPPSTCAAGRGGMALTIARPSQPPDAAVTVQPPVRGRCAHRGARAQAVAEPLRSSPVSSPSPPRRL